MRSAFWKQPIVIAFANVVLPGAGYIILGRRIVFGSLWVVGNVLAWTMAWADPVFYETYNSLYPQEPLGIFIFLVGFVLAAFAFGYDGYQEAKAAQENR